MSPVTDTGTWSEICPITTIVSGTGVCALHQGWQVAVIRVDDRVYAIDNRDPFSGAQVRRRGMVGEQDGRLYVASPLYKQRFELATGRCLDDPAVRIGTWAVQLQGGRISLGDRHDHAAA
jgi:nitrite reductase (NADH) small subunit